MPALQPLQLNPPLQITLVRDAVGLAALQDFFQRQDARLAYAAGLFEGEGSIGIKHSRTLGHAYRYLYLQLTSTDKDVIERFAAVVGVGCVNGGVSGYRVSPNRLPVWKWSASGKAAQSLVSQLEPFLGERRLARLYQVLQEVA